MTPTIVVVGAAARDVAPDDPRGWRLGGGVSYGALTAARLGLPTAAVVGVDDEASGAAELDVLREARVAVRMVPLSRGPVFENIERPEGRFQVCHERSDPLPPEAVPGEWREAPGWLLAPVAAELQDEWADLPGDASFVAVGWQGLLRHLVPGEPTHHLRPGPSAILRRANLVGVSRDDLDRSIELGELLAFLRPGADLAVTQGDHGGIVAGAGEGGPLRLRHYPAVRSRALVDPTGAGDVFLAALAAARVEPRLVGGRIGQGLDLLLAAAAASLVLEGPGLAGVPSRDAVARRMAEGAAARRFAATAGAAPGRWSPERGG